MVRLTNIVAKFKLFLFEVEFIWIEKINGRTINNYWIDYTASIYCDNIPF